MHGVYVYQGSFAVPLASALVRVRESGTLASTGQFNTALAEARTAAALAPNSAIVQLNLADRLADSSRWPAAREHYQLAEAPVRAVRPDLQGDDLLPKIRAGLSAIQSHL